MTQNERRGEAHSKISGLFSNKMDVLVQMREDVREIALVALEVFLQLLPFVWPECAKMCFPKK